MPPDLAHLAAEYGRWPDKIGRDQRKINGWRRGPAQDQPGMRRQSLPLARPVSVLDDAGNGGGRSQQVRQLIQNRRHRMSADS